MINITSKYSLAILAFLVLSLQLNPSVLASGEVTDEQFNISEVSPGNFVHQGKHVKFGHKDSDDIANIGFIVGDRCVAVIDTGGSVEIGQRLLTSIQEKTSKPVCYVINTHIHYDHILGNIAFVNKQTQFIGHQDLADEVNGNRTFFLNEFSSFLGPNPEDSIIGPTLLVKEKLEIDLGNRILELRAYPSAHSHTDLSVFDRNTNTLWLSDLLFVDRIPSLDGNLKSWLQVMSAIKEKKTSHLIPGHGPAIVSGAAAIDRQQQYLQLILSETRKEIAQGAFMEDIIELIGKNEKLNWLLHDQHHKRNITKAFRELEWE